MADNDKSDKNREDLFTGPEEPELPAWLKPVSEEAVVTNSRVGGRWLVPALAASIIVLFIAVIWFLYVKGAEEDLAGEPRLVRAPETPVREAPAERGGIEVPHQDKLVYDRMTGDPRPIDESLRPPPEQPQLGDRKSAPPDEETSQSAEPADADVPSGPASSGAPEPETATTTAAAGGAEDPSPESPTSAPAAQPDADSGSAYRVQLAAFSSIAEAEASWQRLSARYPDLLGPHDYTLEQIERGGRTLIRLQAGAFGTRGEAARLCDRLKNRGQDCLLAAP